MKSKLITKEMLKRKIRSSKYGLVSPEERFWDNVSIPYGTCNCWDWLGTTNNKGYGTMGIKKHQYLAHRISWVLHFGEIPKGLIVCHNCDNPLCIDPYHLFLGTEKDNTKDAVDKGRLDNYSKHRRGSSNGNSKLKKEDVMEIRKLWSQGNLTQREIGELFDVDNTTINKITRGINWSWL